MIFDYLRLIQNILQMNQQNASFVQQNLNVIEENYPKHRNNQQKSTEDEVQLLSNYKRLMSDFSYTKIDLTQIDPQKFEDHKITLLENIYQPFGTSQILKNTHDFVFSVVQTQFYGLQYLYEIIISNFKLKINILNLQRQSDTGEDDIDSKQLGAGSFGEVRVLRVNGKEYAVKRIPFQYKLQPEQGYDYDISKDEQLKLRNALKEYCYFKIFSLLGIGPKIVKSSYDLICFNNCIQFKMQLCQPLINKISENPQMFNFYECKKQLYQKLFMLHSLNFVHRDIKPDNILYNSNEGSFLFGDFGLVSYLKEIFYQKTKTKFVGTPNYCGDEMSKLLSGGSGLVNLYLNDLICLQKTFDSMGEYLFSHNSRISQNSLSFNASGSFFQSGGNSFQQNYENQASESNFTDQSYIPTRNSIFTLPTSHTLAPKKYASSINHYASEIIYTVCRTQQRRSIISEDYLLQLINQKFQQHKNDEISITLALQLYRAFYFKDPNNTIINFIKAWKNSSRHFGPQNIRTLSLLDKLVQASAPKQKQILLQVKTKLANYHSSIKQNQLQTTLMRYLRNFEMFTLSYTSYLISILQQCKNKAINQQQIVYIAKNFIFAMRYLRNDNQEATRLKRLIIKIYQHYNIQIKEESSTLQTLRISLEYLGAKDKKKPIDILNYLQFLQESRDWQSLQMWNRAQNQIKIEVKLILQKIEELDSKQKISLLGLLMRLTKGQKLKNNMQYISSEYLLTASQIVESQIKTNTQDCLQTTLIVFLIQKMLIKYESQNYQDAMKQCEFILQQMDSRPQMRKIFSREYMLVYFYMGVIYISQKQYNFGLNYSQLALKIMQQQIGCLKQPLLTISILNNICLAYRKTSMLQKFDQSLQEVVCFIEKLQPTSFNQKYHKLVYALQIQMLRLQQLRINTHQRKKKASQLVQKIIEGFYLYITKEAQSTTILNYQFIDHLINVQNAKDEDKIYILTEMVRIIKQKHYYLQLFHQQYTKCNLELAIYHKFTLKRNYECIKYIWNSLKTQLLKIHPTQLKHRDYKNVLLYASCLIRAKSNRVAIRFLYSIIQYIPHTLQQIKHKAIKLMHRALRTTGDNKQNLFYQLSRKNFSVLKNRSFMILPQKLSDNPKFRILELKYLKKICLAQMEEFE